MSWALRCTTRSRCATFPHISLQIFLEVCDMIRECAASYISDASLKRHFGSLSFRVFRQRRVTCFSNAPRSMIASYSTIATLTWGLGGLLLFQRRVPHVRQGYCWIVLRIAPHYMTSYEIRLYIAMSAGCSTIQLLRLVIRMKIDYKVFIGTYRVQAQLKTRYIPGSHKVRVITTEEIDITKRKGLEMRGCSSGELVKRQNSNLNWAASASPLFLASSRACRP
jgi:hypothetical protein